MIKPNSIWWKYSQVINWVFTRNLRLVNLEVDQQHPKTKRYALEELKLPDGSPLLSREGEVEVQARLLGNTDQSEISLIDIQAMIGRPGGEYDGHAEAIGAINQALQTGKFECWARPAGGGKRELVAAAEWADLTIIAEMPPVAVLQSGAPVWQELRFKSESAIELWPPEQAGEEAPVSGGAQEEPPAKEKQQIPAPDPTQGNKRPYFMALCEVVRVHYPALDQARSQDLRGDMLRKLMAQKGERGKGFPKTRQARHRAYQEAEAHLENVSLLPEPKPLME